MTMPELTSMLTHPYFYAGVMTALGIGKTIKGVYVDMIKNSTLNKPKKPGGGGGDTSGDGSFTVKRE